MRPTITLSELAQAFGKPEEEIVQALMGPIASHRQLLQFYFQPAIIVMAKKYPQDIHRVADELGILLIDLRQGMSLTVAAKNIGQNANPQHIKTWCGLSEKTPDAYHLTSQDYDRLIMEMNRDAEYPEFIVYHPKGAHV